jgi:hypothetical protein
MEDNRHSISQHLLIFFPQTQSWFLDISHHWDHFVDG